MMLFRRFRKISVFLALVMVISLALPMFSFAVPTITKPVQYEEIKYGHMVEIRWTPPATGTVDHYTVSLRRFNQGDNVDTATGTLLVDKEPVSATMTSYYFPSDFFPDNKKFRLSVCAVMKDGTKQWSQHRYFYTSFHTGSLPRTASFYLWSGFSSETKSHIYYAFQAWNKALNLGYEVINTYPFSSGIENAKCNQEDGLNCITKADDNGKTYLMRTQKYVDYRGNAYEYDINVNPKKSWTNGIQKGYVDVQSAMSHELGHVLGVSHKFDSWAAKWTMYGYENGNSIEKRAIKSYDKEAALKTYNPYVY